MGMQLGEYYSHCSQLHDIIKEASKIKDDAHWDKSRAELFYCQHVKFEKRKESKRLRIHR
jgi:arginine/lysine/ornithine decarboxylase